MKYTLLHYQMGKHTLLNERNYQYPFSGQHNTSPVELIDVFPTINDILGAPKFDKNKYCKPMSPDVTLPDSVCHVLQGKSLVTAILGNIWDESPKAKKIQAKRLFYKSTEGKKSKQFFGFGGDKRQLREQTTDLKSLSPTKRRARGFLAIDRGVVIVDSPMTTNSVQYKNDFSITQSLRCSPVLVNSSRGMTVAEIRSIQDNSRVSSWKDCDRTKPKEFILSVMGYSLRSKQFRYTAWFLFDLVLVLPKMDEGIFEEEVGFCHMSILFVPRLFSDVT